MSIFKEPDAVASDIPGSLAAARGGSFTDLGQLLTYYRDYLLRVAREELAGGVGPMFAASDLVQETFLQATVAFPRFRGNSEAEMRTWLRQILINNIRDAAKFCGAQKRDNALQVSLDVQDSRGGTVRDLSCPRPTPSTIWLSAEQADAVKSAISRLSEPDRIAIEMRSLAGRPFEEIATRLGRSPDAARKLWARAVDRLATELARDQRHGR